MNYGLRLPDVNALWAEARKEEDGNYSLRSVDDGAEQKYWKEVMQRFSGYSPDRYSQQILDRVLGIMAPAGIHTVTEIGPGWGNYTIDFAQRMDKVHCVDISQDTMDYVKRIGREFGLENIVDHHSKWEDYPIPAERTDAVFGYNCFYRMPDLVAAMRKVNDCAKKLCVVGMTTGPEQAYYRALEMELGLKIRFDHQDYIHLLLALDQLGIAPNVESIEMVMPYRFDGDADLLSHAAERIADAQYNKEAVLNVMRQYCSRTGESYSYQHHFHAIILYWQPKKLSPASG